MIKPTTKLVLLRLKFINEYYINLLRSMISSSIIKYIELIFRKNLITTIYIVIPQKYLEKHNIPANQIIQPHGISLFEFLTKPRVVIKLHSIPLKHDILFSFHCIFFINCLICQLFLDQNIPRYTLVIDHEL